MTTVSSWVRLTPFDNKYPNIKPRAIAVIEKTVFVGTNKGLYRLNGNTWEQIFLDEIGEKSKHFPIITLEVKDNVLYAARSYHIDSEYTKIISRVRLSNNTWLAQTDTPLNFTTCNWFMHRQQQV